MPTLADPSPHQRWSVRLSTLVLWALALASVVYWGLRLSAAPTGLAVSAVAPAPPAPDAQALARLLGALPSQAAMAPQAVASPNRFVLVGVLAGQQSGGGAALIAVDGQPAKPFRVGAVVVDGELVLQSLGRREARLGASQGAATTLTLELPPLR